MLLEGFAYPPGDALQAVSVEQDELGLTHVRFQHVHAGRRVEGSGWHLHEDAGGRVYLAHGEVFTQFLDAQPAPLLGEAAAVEQTLRQIGAARFAWQSPAHEQALKSVLRDPGASYFPKGELVWFSPDLFSKLKKPAAAGKPAMLAYRFDVYALEPTASRRWYFADAFTGRLVGAFDRMATGCFEHPLHDAPLVPTGGVSQTSLPTPNFVLADVPASGFANYVDAAGGVVNFFTESVATDSFTLHPQQGGPLGTQAIHTQNANNTGGGGLVLTEFSDPDNFWEGDTVGVGVHWATQAVYDYYLANHNRNSIDNAGMPLLSRVHYSLVAEGYPDNVNAFWDGTQMTYGDGDGVNWGPLTSLDVVGHELTHGVTERNGNGGLFYYYESGALNESFSDIFGAVVEFEEHPDGGDWLMGEDFDFAQHNGFRNMQNPNVEGHPKTYYGSYYYTGSFDNGGVHINSGVQNHWFYLLAEGGTGTNEFGHSYDVDSIGLTDAAKIAYRNLTNYLAYTASFADARAGSIQAAADLFGAGSVQAQAVADAWCAVGVGAGCQATITITAPASQEVLTAGTNYNLQWSSTLPPSSLVKIEYSNGATWQLVADNAPNSGSFNWFVENDYGTNSAIRITDAGDPGIARPANFAIYDLTPVFEIVPCLVANSFSGPSTVSLGDTVTYTSLVSGLSYAWRVDGVLVGTDTFLQYVFNLPDAYLVELTVESAAGCLNIEERIVTSIADNSLSFNKHLGSFYGTIGNYVQDVVQTADGGYAVATADFELPNHSPENVLKFDAFGNLLWHSPDLPFGPFPRNISSLLEKPNGNLLLVYTLDTAHVGTSNYPLAVAELDGTTGAVVGNVSVFSAGAKLFPKHVMARDSNILIGGDALVNGQYDVFLLELTPSLAVTSQKWFGDSLGHENFLDLIETTDGGYLLAFSQWYDYFNMQSYFVMAKTDSAFNIAWKKGHGAGGYPAFVEPGLSRMQVVEIPDCGGYMAVIAQNFLERASLLKTDHLGNRIFVKHYKNGAPAIPYQCMRDIVWDGDDGFTMASTFIADAEIYPGLNIVTELDYHLMNVDFDGNVNWEKRIHNLDANTDYNWYRMKLLATSDGGYLSLLPGFYGYGVEGYLLKTDRQGFEACSLDTMTTVPEEYLYFKTVGNIKTDFTASPGIAALTTVPLGGPTEFAIGNQCPSIQSGSVTAAFSVKNWFVDLGESPVIVNQSLGGNAFTWEVDGAAAGFPLPPFATPGLHEISLTAMGGGDTSSVSRKIFVRPAQTAGPLDFTATPLDGGGLMKFETNQTDPANAYFWNFDPALPPDSGMVALHNYYFDGNYQACHSMLGCHGMAVVCEEVEVDCPSAQPVVADTTICAGDSATLVAQITSPGSILWYDSPTGSSPLDTGISFVTPPLVAGVHDYFVEREIQPDTLTFSPDDDPGGYAFDFNWGLYLTSKTHFKLHEFEVHTGQGGTLKLHLLHHVFEAMGEHDTLFTYETVVASLDTITVPVNLVLSPGVYTISVNSSSTADIKVYNFPAQPFPLQIPGYGNEIQIPGTWLGTGSCCVADAVTWWKPSFYNFKVSLHEACISDREEVLVTANPAPANDLCASATNLPLNGTANPFSLTCAAADSPTPPCASQAAGDVWFSFNAPASGFLSLNINGLSEVGFALYENCGTLLDCEYDHSGAMSVEAVLGSLAPGTAYQIRIWSETTAATSGQITLADGCPPTLAVNGQPIDPSTYQASEVTSTGRVAEPSVMFRASGSIQLDGGFQVDSSAVFEATMGGCVTSNFGGPAAPGLLQTPGGISFWQQFDPAAEELHLKYWLREAASPVLLIYAEGSEQPFKTIGGGAVPQAVGEYRMKLRTKNWPPGNWRVRMEAGTTGAEGTVKR